MSFVATFDAGSGNNHSITAAHDGEAGRRAGLDFNPAGDAGIAAVKAFSAVAMQAVINARDRESARYSAAAREQQPDAAAIARHQDAMRNFATALTHLDAGKMFAVNGIAATLGDA